MVIIGLRVLAGYDLCIAERLNFITWLYEHDLSVNRHNAEFAHQKEQYILKYIYKD